MTNFNDPESRLALIESVGVAEYNRQMEAWQKSQEIGAENGYTLRHVNGGMWGRLVQVCGTNSAFSTEEQARAYARTLTPGINGRVPA